jgi:[ribosomal protein S5]-alanine N-acetyltransferase
VPGHEIGTSRLVMLPRTPDHLDVVHRIWNHPSVRHYLWDEQEVTREGTGQILRESAASFEERGVGIWGVVLRESGEEVGFCGFRVSGDPDLVYGLLPDYWELGLATEAARAAVRYAFERLGVERVTASADVENAASVRVMERVGMRFARYVDVGGRALALYEITAAPG